MVVATLYGRFFCNASTTKMDSVSARQYLDIRSTIALRMVNSGYCDDIGSANVSSNSVTPNALLPTKSLCFSHFPFTVIPLSPNCRHRFPNFGLSCSSWNQHLELTTMKISAELIKRLREEKQWSQEQLAELCSLNLRTIQRLEKSGNASLESVRALASVFELDAKELQGQEPMTKLSPWDSVHASLKQFDDFWGVASRYEYWCFIAFTLLVLAVATVLHPKAYQIAGLILLVPLLAVGSRRLNDAAQSVWLQLFFLVPFGFVVVLFYMAMESKTLESSSENQSAA
jgi:transcriptional regulator with XRE-family HTH domain